MGCIWLLPKVVLNAKSKESPLTENDMIWVLEALHFHP